MLIKYTFNEKSSPKPILTVKIGGYGFPETAVQQYAPAKIQPGRQRRPGTANFLLQLSEQVTIDRQIPLMRRITGISNQFGKSAVQFAEAGEFVPLEMLGATDGVADQILGGITETQLLDVDKARHFAVAEMEVAKIQVAVDNLDPGGIAHQILLPHRRQLLHDFRRGADVQTLKQP